MELKIISFCSRTILSWEKTKEMNHFNFDKDEQQVEEQFYNQ